MKSVLFLLSGNANKIAAANNIDIESMHIVKLDEKELSNPLKVVRLIKNYRKLSVYFGTIDINFQRFQTFIKIYLFLAGCKGVIIDELGQRIKFTIAKLLFIELPLLLVEIIYSVYLVIYYHIKIYFLKWKYTKH